MEVLGSLEKLFVSLHNRGVMDVGVECLGGHTPVPCFRGCTPCAPPFAHGRTDNSHAERPVQGHPMLSPRLHALLISQPWEGAHDCKQDAAGQVSEFD